MQDRSFENLEENEDLPDWLVDDQAGTREDKSSLQEQLFCKIVNSQESLDLCSLIKKLLGLLSAD